jgi:hypothetical protein
VTTPAPPVPLWSRSYPQQTASSLDGGGTITLIVAACGAVRGDTAPSGAQVEFDEAIKHAPVEIECHPWGIPDSGHGADASEGSGA